MTDAMLVFISSISGTIVGALASVGGQLVIAKSQRKAQLMEQAIAAALAEFEQTMKLYGGCKGAEIAPLGVYILSMRETLRLLDEGKVTASTLKPMLDQIDEIKKLIRQRESAGN